MHELRDLGISMATLSLCLSSKEKLHQEYQWQISLLHLHLGRKDEERVTNMKTVTLEIHRGFSNINWFLATVSTTQLHAPCCM